MLLLKLHSNTQKTEEKLNAMREKHQQLQVIMFVLVCVCLYNFFVLYHILL